jgi:hypothetical protein
VSHTFHGWSGLRPICAANGRASSFWCDAADTRWSKAMRNQIVVATLVSWPGVRRTRRFDLQNHPDR